MRLDGHQAMSLGILMPDEQEAQMPSSTTVAHYSDAVDEQARRLLDATVSSETKRARSWRWRWARGEGAR